MQVSRRFAQYVRENGINNGTDVCGIYRLVRVLNDGRRAVATFIDPYNQFDDPRAELRVFIQGQLDVEERGLGHVDSAHRFENGQWVHVDGSDPRYQALLESGLKSLKRNHYKARVGSEWERLRLAA